MSLCVPVIYNGAYCGRLYFTLPRYFDHHPNLLEQHIQEFPGDATVAVLFRRKKCQAPGELIPILV